MSKVYNGTPQDKKFNSITARDVFDKCLELLHRKEKRIVTVNTGDAWSQNIMVRTPEFGEQDVMILDFQLARCGNPVHDLGNFIYTSTHKEVRDKYFYKLLEYYHAELGQTLSLLGSNIEEICPLDSFMKEVKPKIIRTSSVIGRNTNYYQILPIFRDIQTYGKSNGCFNG